MAGVQRERIHALDNALLCDVCKSDYFVFYRDSFMGEAAINIECPGCHEEKTSINEVNFAAWCQRFHPELTERLGHDPERRNRDA